LTDVDDEEGSDLEIVWTKEPQSLTLKTAKEPVTFVIGAHRTIWRFDRKKEEYAVDKEDDIVDFLPPHPPSEVSATSQVAKVWGTAQAFWAADGDLDTSWNIDTQKTGGCKRSAQRAEPAETGARTCSERSPWVGQALTMKWKQAVDVRLIRLVPGCASDKDAWNDHDRVQAFRITLSSGVRFEIDRRKLDAAVPGVRAAGEFPLPAGFGGQVLIFLQEAQSVNWAKLEIQDLDGAGGAKASRVHEACVSEISFH
jgi:hypothetical protein